MAAARLWALGFTVFEAYGLTETGPAVSVDDPRRPRFGSVGFPLPGVDVRIEPSDLGGPDEGGEIVVRSPSLFSGYLDDPEETARVLHDGWFKTGDLGRLDGDGRLWITGRAKEVIVLGSGKNVYPHEVEARLDESPFIVESCVVGLAEDGRKGTEKLHAVVVPDLDALRRAGESRIEVTLRDEVNRIGDRLPSHHRVVGIRVRPEPLPRTPLGKLKRHQVYRELVASGPGPGGPREDRSAAVEAEPGSPSWPAVQKALARTSGRRAPVHPGSSLELDLGLDSLARVEALAALEEELGAKLPEGFAAHALTAGEVLAAVDAFLASTSGEVALTSGFQGLATQAGDAELRTWPRRLLRPLGLAFLLLAVPPVALVARLLWGFRVRGREHLPEGAYLVCPNHASYVDAAVVVLALPFGERLRFWGLGDYQIFRHPLWKALAWAGHVIRLDPGAALRATLAAGGAVLRSGAPLVLFPEGARAPEGQRLEFRRGAAILARAVGAPIVPAWIEGSERLLPRGSWRPRLGHRLAVRFGVPIDPRGADAAADPAAALTEILRERVLALGAEERARSG